ncbi:hypothetical protein C8Q76DRAFT_792248 [Earliella scabrosa]|nr:hypothetical protein C8Q76DRAFT_792248 [Earliella scabrosa]
MEASSGASIDSTPLTSSQASGSNHKLLTVIPAGPPPTLLQELSLSSTTGSIDGVPSFHIRDAIHHFFDVLVDARVRVALSNPQDDHPALSTVIDGGEFRSLFMRGLVRYFEREGMIMSPAAYLSFVSMEGKGNATIHYPAIRVADLLVLADVDLDVSSDKQSLISQARKAEPSSHDGDYCRMIWELIASILIVSIIVGVFGYGRAFLHAAPANAPTSECSARTIKTERDHANGPASEATDDQQAGADTAASNTEGKSVKQMLTPPSLEVTG